MAAQLTKKLANLVREKDDGSVKVIDPIDDHEYYIVDGRVHLPAMDALRRQQDRDAIAVGISQMEAGEGVALPEARKQTRQHLLARGK